MTITVMSADQVRSALAIRDLTDPNHGPHAVQLLLAAIEEQVAQWARLPVTQHRANPVVPVVDNYDRLGYPADAIARDTRYTRYLTPELMLRAHTTAAIPALLSSLATQGAPETLLSCPGMCYRRDSIDRHHVGQPHHLELWRIRPTGEALTSDDLSAMVEAILSGILPGRKWRLVPTEHPYTLCGRQIDVVDGDNWIEVGECGLASPALLRASGLSNTASGLAMGLGLDRLLMLCKGIDDIRLLRSTDPRIANQLLDLSLYTPVSTMPPIRRDVSIAVPLEWDEEQLGEMVRDSLGGDAVLVEEIAIVSETEYDALPPVARERLGIHNEQKNILVRVVLRALERTLTDDEANVLRDRIYAALHQGG